MSSSRSDSKDGIHCWVAAGDVDIRKQSFAPRRATPAYFHLPLAEGVPRTTIPDLFADIREGLEEVFDRPGSRAPFIPGYTNKDDAIARAKLLRGPEHGISGILQLRLTKCSHKVGYRKLAKYANDVSYQGAGLFVTTNEVLIICEPFTKVNVVEQIQLPD